MVADAGGLGQDGDAALALEIVGVEDAVDDGFVIAKDAALVEHGVDQCGLAMVDVGYDGDVADVLYVFGRGTHPTMFTRCGLLTLIWVVSEKCVDEKTGGGCVWPVPLPLRFLPVRRKREPQNLSSAASICAHRCSSKNTSSSVK